jgi:hypothetical protein
MLSSQFISAARNHDGPVYRLARRAGLHPASLYKILIGHDIPKFGDERVLKVARSLGLSAESCWEIDPEDSCLAHDAATETDHEGLRNGCGDIRTRSHRRAEKGGPEP